MTEATFRAQRRQKFLTEKYFLLNQTTNNFLVSYSLEALPKRKAKGDFGAFGEGGIFKHKLQLLKLHYTAGDPIESLMPLYATTIDWFGKWHEAEIEYSKHLAAARNEDLRLDMTPVMFEDLSHFQLAIDVVSLGILFGDGDRLRDIARWMQSSRDTDMLFETLLEPAVTDPRQTEDFFHVVPYDPLLDAVYTVKTPEERSAKVKQYLDGWYKAFDGVPWHNGHLVQNEEYSNYYGYWSFEAAAICVIHGIDDSSFRDHLLYPKDLADWARVHRSLDHIKPGAKSLSASQQNRVSAGHPCPREGWWLTPAKVGSRRFFKAMEIMPKVETDYGDIIWQWDTDQVEPKL